MCNYVTFSKLNIQVVEISSVHIIFQTTVITIMSIQDNKFTNMFIFFFNVVTFGKLYFSFNTGYLYGSIRNDTQSDTPNNRMTVLTSNNRSLSPNNSIESHSSSIKRYTATPNQVSVFKNYNELSIE